MDRISKRPRKSQPAKTPSVAGYDAAQRQPPGQLRDQNDGLEQGVQNRDTQKNIEEGNSSLIPEQQFSVMNLSVPTVTVKDESVQDTTSVYDHANPYTCKVCDKHFKQSCHLSRHMSLHDQEKRHRCHICHREFARKDCLTKHIFRIHLGERPFPCDVCGMAFTEAAALKRHEVVHADRKPFQCDQCGRTFSQATYLKHHLMTHGGGRTMPYACDVCGMRFSMLSRLKKHALIHMGVKPYQCDICGRYYSRGEYIKQHKNTVHASLFQS